MNSENLRLAIIQGDLVKVQNFVEMTEGNIEKRFEYKNATVWHIAAIGKEDKHIAVLEWLLHKFRHEITTDVLNQQEENYLTPCHYAAMVGNIKAFQLLVSYGADPTAQNHLHYTPRDLLKKRGYKHLVYQLDNIIAHEKLLQEQVQQAEPTQLEELIQDAALIHSSQNSASHSLSSATQCLFSPLRNLLQRRDKPKSSEREMVTYNKKAL
ncbi:MAG: hypothetical protein K0S11_1085 [Gammaproteobacteria bacterium]|nr:hypothetical protein [Gammaproteobacteria bacterium]